MITIATFNKAEEAHLLRMRLEAAGIPAFLQNEYIVQMDWLMSNIVGGVRVQIADEDVGSAREFLAADKPQASPDAEDVICPQCGSKDTLPDERFRRIALLGLLVPWLILLTPVAFVRRRWRCASCHHSFKVPATN